METILLASPSPFLAPPVPLPSTNKPISKQTDKRDPKAIFITKCSLPSDPWSPRDATDLSRRNPRSKSPNYPLPDDNARRIIKSKARYLSLLRKRQGSRAMTPKWIKRTPEQMVQYLEDDKNGHLYGKHVLAAIKTLRGMSRLAEEDRDVRRVMCGFVGKLSFREMCVVLKEQRGWREARDFFAWMKLQLCYRPNVMVYTLMLRIYGKIGKIKLAEQTFLEMLEAGCEPDEVACGTMLCTYARWGRHKAMFSFYAAVEKRGIHLSVSVFNFMLSSLQKTSLHEKVIEIWQHMVDKRVAPNNFTYTVVISSLVKEGFHDEAFKTFNEMKSIGYVPEEVIYSLLISASNKNGKWDEAQRLYEDMRSCKIVPSHFTCASLLSLYYKTEDYSKALSLFTEMQSNKIPADEVIYGLLIRIYGKLGLYEDAQKAFLEIEQLGLLTDEKTYLAMAQVHLNSGNFEKALSTIEQMQSRNIWLSRFGYIVLLQCYVMKEDLSCAEDTFQALSKTGLPDAGSCNDMLNLYVRLNLTEKAKKFILQMRKDGVDFDEELLKTVIGVLCKEGMQRDVEQLIGDKQTKHLVANSRYFQSFFMAMQGKMRDHQNFMASNQVNSLAIVHILTLHLADGNTSKIEEILKLLLKNGSGLSVVNEIVGNFIRGGNISKAERVVNLVTTLGYKVDDSIVASLITSYGKQRKLKQAEEVFAAIADHQICEKSVFNSMIDAYIKCGKPDEAYFLYQEVTEKGHDLDPVTVGIVVNALTNSGKHQKAENIIQKSMKYKELDTVTYNIFIKAMLRAGKLHFAAGIYQHMLSFGVTPSIQTYNTMITVYRRGQKLDKAVEMFNTAHSLGLRIDEKAYTNMVIYYAKAGKRHEAFMLFSKMQEEGIRPGQLIYNVMINMYGRAGLHHEAEELVRAMEEDGCQPDSFTYQSLVQAYAKSSKYSKAEETIDIMRKKSISPSSAHFNHLFFAFAKAGLLEEAERVYKELLAVCSTPDLACYQIMLRGYMDYGHVEEGIKFYEHIKMVAGPNRFMMSAAVHLYMAAGKKLEAEAILESMNSLRIPFLPKLSVGSKLPT